MPGLLVALTLLASPHVVGPLRQEIELRGSTEVIVLLRPGATAAKVLPGGVVVQRHSA